jgi:hypothetical protein
MVEKFFLSHSHLAFKQQNRSYITAVIHETNSNKWIP